MWTNRSSCRLAHDFGGQKLGNPSGKDEQKAVFIEPQVAPKPEECLVYSFGINSEWSFDEEMEQYGCQVFAFDPSMAMEPHDKHTPGIHFYNWGLGERDEILETSDKVTKWQMYSLSSIYKTLSVRHGPKIIDYLKMNIEGSEVEGPAGCNQDGHALQNPPTRPRDPPSRRLSAGWLPQTHPTSQSSRVHGHGPLRFQIQSMVHKQFHASSTSEPTSRIRNCVVQQQTPLC